MKITYKKPNKEFLQKYKLPDNTQVDDVYELDVHWWEPAWWSIKFWSFVMSVCERIVPSLKGKNDEIKIEW